MVKKKFAFGVVALFAILVFLGFAFTAVLDSPNSVTVNQGQATLYNVTLNNTAVIKQVQNASNVTIQLPTGFAFVTNSNISTSNCNFTAVGATKITWWNGTGPCTYNEIINASTNVTYFLFNLTATVVPNTNPWIYNLTVIFSNMTASNWTNISVAVASTHTAVRAATTAATNIFRINQSQNYFFNITVNNSNLGQIGNISQVNITLPAGLIFTNATNGTNAAVTNNTNLSQTITWTDMIDPVINGTNTAGTFSNQSLNFWFNATAPATVTSMGYFNITVTTMAGVGGVTNSTYSTNITVLVWDPTAPTISLYSPANMTSATTNAYNFTFNVTDTSPVNCTLFVTEGSSYMPFQFFSSVNNPITDNNTGMYNSSLSVLTHRWNVNCTDIYGNTANSTIWWVDVKAAAAAAAETPGGSGAATTTWSFTYSATDAQVSSGYTNDLKVKERILANIASAQHSIGVTGLTATTASIIVESTPQPATLAIGDVRKFDVNADSFYDLSVKLNSITGSKASLTVTSIHEAVTTETAAQQQQAEAAAAGTTAAAEGKSLLKNVWFWVILVVIIIVIVALIVYYKNKR